MVFKGNRVKLKLHVNCVLQGQEALGAVNLYEAFDVITLASH